MLNRIKMILKPQEIISKPSTLVLNHNLVYDASTAFFVLHIPGTRLAEMPNQYHLI